MGDEVHVIKLTSVWERSPQGGWLRKFGLPSRLGSGHRVHLLVSGVGDEPEMCLNGHPLGPAEHCRDGRYGWDVTRHLQRRNTLELGVAGGDMPPPVGSRASLPEAYGEVSLEITDLAHLNNA